MAGTKLPLTADRLRALWLSVPAADREEAARVLFVLVAVMTLTLCAWSALWG